MDGKEIYYLGHHVSYLSAYVTQQDRKLWRSWVEDDGFVSDIPVTELRDAKGRFVHVDANSDPHIDAPGWAYG